MHRLLDLTLATVGGWVGWLLGSQLGTVSGFIVGIVGTGLGLYAGRRITLYFFG